MSASASPTEKLPVGWAEVMLGDLISLEYGKALTEESRDRTGAVPVIGSSGKIGAHSSSLIDGPCLVVGRKGNVGAVHILREPCWPIDTVYFVIPPRGLDLKFLHYSLSYLRLDKLDRSTAVPGLSRSDAYACTTALPPTAEQLRIVEELEALFSDLDAAIHTLERAVEKLKRYRQAVLKAAVEGDLSRDWREAHRDQIEPASELLTRAMIKGGYAAHSGFDSEKLFDLPAGWTWACLGSLASLKGGITKDSKRIEDSSREVPYLRVANVQRGYLNLEEMKTIHATEEKIRDLRLEPGDVLFNEGGDRDKLGRGWVWRGELPECIHQNHVFRARLAAGFMKPEIVSWFGNTWGKGFFERKGKQTTNLASVNITTLAALPIPVIPAQEQEVILAEVNRQLSVIDKLSSLLDSNLRRASCLRQSILEKAFRGELVPQDPHDEPVSLLLERIRTQRAAAVKSKPARLSKKRARQAPSK